MPCLPKPIYSQLWILVLFLLFISHCLYAADKIPIQIEGVKGEMLDNVRAYLSLEQQKNHPRLSASRIHNLHNRAPEEIQQALQPFGYYRVKVTSHLKSTTEPPGWQARYIIELGEPLKLKTLEIHIDGEANKDNVFQQLLHNFPIKVGDILNQLQYEKGQRNLLQLAEERGYFDAQLTQHEIHFDEQAYTARVILKLDSHQRYRFGKVKFQHNNEFKESLLQRFLTFKPGDFYTGNALLAFKSALTNSDYFAKVDVEMERAATTPVWQVPIKVTLEPHKRNRYAFGIGYGTDTGVRGSVEWKRRYINRYGHQFATKIELSEIRQSATARYLIPIGKTIDNFLTITAGYRDESTDTSDSELLLLGIGKHQTRTFLKRKLEEVIGIEYRDERYTVGSDSGHARLLMPYINWSYIKADNRIYTWRGHKIELGVRGALDNIGSNVSFLQTRLNSTVIRRLWAKGRVIARGELGYTSMDLLDGEFSHLPPSIRFFAGGDRSIRGYDYLAVGPKNQEGQVLGGKNLLVGSLEYEQKILDKLSLAVFYDMGNAFNDFSEPLKHGAGIGVRWQSPVGLIRVDVATALSEEGYPLRLHITVGPDL